MSDVRAHDDLAALFEYPRGDLRERVAAARLALEGLDPALGRALDSLERHAEERPPTEHEELFTRTFDIGPSCSLECGWHLYGEDYARGTFLVSMRDALRRYGVEETVELPDHLTHVMAVLGRMEPAMACKFAVGWVIPALEKMAAGFPQEDNPYREAFGAVKSFVIARHAPEAEPANLTPAEESTPYVGRECPLPGPASQGERHARK